MEGKSGTEVGGLNFRPDEYAAVSLELATALMVDAVKAIRRAEAGGDGERAVDDETKNRHTHRHPDSRREAAAMFSMGVRANNQVLL